MAHRLLDPTARPSRLPGLLVLSLAAALTLAFSLFLASRSASPTVLWLGLQTVSSESLISSGITLLPPPAGAEASAVPQSVAEQRATVEWPRAGVRETVLARLVDLGSVPATDRLAWVVSVDPAAVGVPTHGYTFVNDFALVFIDAQTGEFLSGTVMSHIVGSQPDTAHGAPTPIADSR